jgi:transcriptional regulator with XRE-family HTH domain
MDLSGFASLLDRAFLEYRIKQTRQRLSVSLNSFASYLDFSPPIVNLWLGGHRLPTEANVERLVPKLVELLDMEVYDTLDIPRPDPFLQRLDKAWPHLSITYRQKLAEMAEIFLQENENQVSMGQERDINVSEEQAEPDGQQ